MGQYARASRLESTYEKTRTLKSSAKYWVLRARRDKQNVIRHRPSLRDTAWMVYSFEILIPKVCDENDWPSSYFCAAMPETAFLIESALIGALLAKVSRHVSQDRCQAQDSFRAHASLPGLPAKISKLRSVAQRDQLKTLISECLIIHACISIYCGNNVCLHN